ncbi:MAG: Ger(x)C family spore germination protein [Bacillaceae bacterium]|nr:Ger(x)C family spore germination protein [Bacillaceae bacterium]
MKCFRKLFLLFCCLIFTTGCWDQKLLKDLKLVFTVGFDLEENRDILTTIAIRETTRAKKGGGQGEAIPVVIDGRGKTVRETRLNIERKSTGEFSPSKTRIYLLGEELAREDLYSIFDVLYRDAHAPLGAKVVITQNRASDIIHMKFIAESLMSEGLSGILQSSEDDSFIKQETVQTICPILFDSGVDFALPVLAQDGPGTVQVIGMGLISDKVFTGTTITTDDSTLMLILNDVKSKKAQFQFLINENEENFRDQFITLNVKKFKRDMKVNADSPSTIEAKIDLTLHLVVTEYPHDELMDYTYVKEIEKQLEPLFVQKAKSIIEVLQENNCDLFGIGQKVRSYHTETWDQIDWRETYPNITIEPNIHVKIVGTGLIK